ncbi:MAG: winged helix DNA-binding protein, partial [Alphaproteobacteria bacterium]|nr:winged helix DNA-binding protein [Alphaproteobacteria bacterium]
GYYIGTNATYNIKKLINAGYLASTPSSYDKRAIYLRLTSKGQELIQKLDKNLTQYMNDFEAKTKGKFNLTKGIEFLKDIETFWNEVLLLRS